MKETRRPEWFFLTILAFIQFTHILDFVIIMPLGPTLREVFKITPREFGFIVSSYTYSAFFFGILSSFFVDRWDRKVVLVVSYTGFIIGTFFCALAPNYYILIGARAVAGAFGGILGSIIFSIIGDLIPFERRGKATGIVMSAFSIASVLGVPLGLKATEKFGWNSPFYFLTAFSIVVLIFTVLLHPRVNTHLAGMVNRKPMETLIVIFSDKNHLTAFALISMMMFAGFSVIPFIAPYMVSNVGVLKEELPYIYALGGGLTIFTARFIGILSDKFGKPRIFTIIAIISIFPILTITSLPRVPLYIALIVTSTFFVFVSGRFIPAMAMITSSVLPKNRGGFMSVNSSIQQLASGIASTVAGLILGESVTGEIINYQYVGILAGASTVCCIFIARKLKVAGENPI